VRVTLTSMDALISSFLSDIVRIFVAVAWIVVPVFLGVVFWQLRLLRKRLAFLSGVSWEMIEIRIPRDNLKTPKSMEQVFTSLYGIYSFGIPWMPKYLDGKVDLWVSFEIVGNGGGISFYVRTPSQFRNLVESAIYSQYPDAELVDAPDYVMDFPSQIPNDVYDIWGTDFGLAKSSVYPLRTYYHFEDPKEERRTDPLATITEAMSKLKDDESVWIQLMVSPTGSATGFDLKKKAEEEIKKIIEEKSTKRTDHEGKEVSSGLMGLSEGYRNIIKEIENKASKHAFEVTLRFIYIDKKENFSPLNIAAIMGSFQQFNTQNMNALKPAKLITVLGGWTAKLVPYYKKNKMLAKKRRLYDFYRSRCFGYSNHTGGEELPVLNTEELATLFHFPAGIVKAPKLRAVLSRKGEPPVDLPIE